MARSVWQLLLENPADLTCDECFAVMEYYAELLAKGSTDLLAGAIDHLEGCPNCEARYREALSHLIASQSETNTASPSDLKEALMPKSYETIA